MVIIVVMLSNDE